MNAPSTRTYTRSAPGRRLGIRFRKQSVPADAGMWNPQLSSLYHKGAVASWLAPMTSIESILPRAMSIGSSLAV